MRILVLAVMAAVALTVFAPASGSGLMRSVVHGFGLGIGREIAHGMLGHHRRW